MVGLVQRVVVVIAMVAGLLGATAAALPGAIPTTVPAVCVQVPLLGNGGLQAGYCP
ncbi:MAG TPA: hypothetical protein VFB78_05160 [Acidimicrobiales bacterium]|nr:hypothetical protein [Acidimicrobiales bacterium]